MGMVGIFLLPPKFIFSLKDPGFERFIMRSDFKKISTNNIENKKSYSDFAKSEKKLIFFPICTRLRPPSLKSTPGTYAFRPREWAVSRGRHLGSAEHPRVVLVG